MVKSFLEYDVYSLITIKQVAHYAHEVQMLEYRLRHGDHVTSPSLLKYLPKLHSEMCEVHANKNTVAWLLKRCGFFEVKELLEKLMKQYGVEENEVVLNG